MGEKHHANSQLKSQLDQFNMASGRLKQSINLRRCPSRMLQSEKVQDMGNSLDIDA